MLHCEVYKDPLGDFTNGGISSYHDTLDLVSDEGPFIATGLFRLVKAENRHVYGDEHYMDVVPVIYPVTRSCMWMAGGNILYTSDARFMKTTGLKYPLCIHDRYEGPDYSRYYDD